MYDFDKLFSAFVLKKGHVHEDELGEIYEEWLGTFCKELGKSPREVLDGMNNMQLVKELREECENGSPSLTVMENIEKRAPISLLLPLLYEDNETLVYCAAELLYNLDKAPLDIFAELLPTVKDEELFELMVSALKENPDSVKERLYEIASGDDMRLKTVVGEILAEGGRDERTFKLLSELFASGDNIPLYAGYLARYGDEMAVSMLYRALETASYADYIEIRNAIESLGGIVSEERDFSADPEYNILKEHKSGN